MFPQRHSFIWLSTRVDLGVGLDFLTGGAASVLQSAGSLKALMGVFVCV